MTGPERGGRAASATISTWLALNPLGRAGRPGVIMVMPTGIRAPPPSPCSAAEEATSSGQRGRGGPHRRGTPTVNTVIAASSNVTGPPKRSPIQPDNGHRHGQRHQVGGDHAR